VQDPDGALFAKTGRPGQKPLGCGPSSKRRHSDHGWFAVPKSIYGAAPRKNPPRLHFVRVGTGATAPASLMMESCMKIGRLGIRRPAAPFKDDHLRSWNQSR